MRVLWQARGTLRASSLFHRVDGSRCAEDFTPLAREAAKLERQGLLEHVAGPDGTLRVGLTRRAHIQFSLRQAHPGRAVAAAFAAPVLASCVALAPTTAPPVVAPPKAVPQLRMEQLVVDGQLVWGWCAADTCPQPTPKAIEKPAPIAQAPANVAPVPQARRPSADAPASDEEATTTPPSALPVTQAAPLERAVEPTVVSTVAAPGAVPPAATLRARHAVFFHSGSAVLTTEERAHAQALAQGLRVASSVRLVGMTDGVGPAIHNRALARQRAEAVARELVKSGVPSSVIAIDTSIVGDLRYAFSEGRLGVPDAQLRRVEMLVRYASPEMQATGTASAPRT